MLQRLKSLLRDTHPLRLLYHKLKAMAATLLSGWPAKKLTVICITGTDGKTTTVAMTAHILHHAGKTVGASSSAFFEVNGKREHNPTQKTTVPPFALQRFLKRLVHENCEFAVLESSSHGLLQGRLWGIQPVVAAITNISQEHLDYHGTMGEYIRAKGLLFKALKGEGMKVLNKDDATYEVYSKILSDHTVTYSPSGNTQSDLWMTNVHASPEGCTAHVHHHDEEADLHLSIPGIFNLANALTAIGCCVSVGIPFQECVTALTTFRGAPGRMEKIEEGQSFTVLIDFTVTPAAYEATLKSVTAMKRPGSRILVLTGSCGDRMKEKRPVVGKLCSDYADVVVVSNEDPYTEDPMKIIDDVFTGIRQNLPTIDVSSLANPPHTAFAVKIPDRLSAIRFLLQHAKPDDIVLLCGKGGDVTMWTKEGRIPWDEEEIVREELRREGRNQKAENMNRKLTTDY
jgi:UDP-N-acetylmuramyl-tripeptide synthetase